MVLDSGAGRRWEFWDFVADLTNPTPIGLLPQWRSRLRKADEADACALETWNALEAVPKSHELNTPGLEQTVIRPNL